MLEKPKYELYLPRRKENPRRGKKKILTIYFVVLLCLDSKINFLFN